MTAFDSIPKNSELLQQIFETAKTARKVAKKKRTKAEKKFKKAEQKSTGNFELQILHLKYLKAKHKHKSLIAVYKLAEFQWKHALKHAGALTEEHTVTTSSEGKAHAKNPTQNTNVSFVHPEKLKKNADKEKKHVDKNEKIKEKKQGRKEITDAKIHSEGHKSVQPEHTSAEKKNDHKKQKQSVVQKSTVDTAPNSPILPPQGKPDTLKSAPVVQTIKIVAATPPPAERVQKIAPVMKTADAVDYSTNDLTLIEGIGKKVAHILNENSIITFKNLSVADTENLKLILRKNRLQMMNPSTWAEQAQLIVDGKLDALKQLQIELKGSKRI